MVPIHTIVSAVAGRTGVSCEQIVGQSRAAPIVLARFAVYFIAFHYGHSYSDIGRVLGDRDHGTVRHGVDKANQLRRENLVFAELIRSATRQFGSDL